MRMLVVCTLVLAALSLPGLAQDAPRKTKAPQYRTYADSIDMRSSQASLRGFLDAYAASDFFKAYLLLSPDAKSDFLNKVFEFNEAHLFPGMAAGKGPTGGHADSDILAGDLLRDIYLDGVVVFDQTMLSARNIGVLPFDFEAGAVFSPTFERESEARYNVQAKGQPANVIISTVRLSNGDWRIERIVWPASDPEARPWGFVRAQ